MKKVLSILAAVLMAANLSAQSPDLLSDNYSRNSLSYVYVNYAGDKYNSNVSAVMGGWSISQKFDQNILETRSIDLSTSRGNGTESDFAREINRQGVGRQIIGYWFNRQPDGSMDDSRMKARSEYSATDADVVRDQAAQVKVLAMQGEKLMQHSYVVVYDAKNFRTSQYKNKKTGKVTTTYLVDVYAYAYKIELNQTVMDDIYNNVWIYSDDNAATKAQKKENFKKLNVNMAFIASAHYSGSSADGYNAALSGAHDDLMFDLTKKIADWQVKVPIYKVHPIMAKIGTKEGLSNGDRYRVYKFMEDEQGNLKTFSKGYVRATTVADNEGVASGSSAMSRFYQISGTVLHEGMLLKEEKDLRIGVSASAVLGGHSFANFRIDYLANITDHGICHYPFLNIGLDLAESDYDGESRLFYSAALGYGLGLPISRFLEFQPFANFGADLVAHDEDDGGETMDWAAYFAAAGARFSIRPTNNFSLFVEAEYSISLMEGDLYKLANGSSDMLSLSDDRFGLAFSGGIRINF